MAVITGDDEKSLSDFGIIVNEKTFLLHGHVSLRFEEGDLNLGLLAKPARIGVTDITRSNIITAAARCMTVENAATLHELAKLSSGTILASSGSEGGFANSAVISFLKSIPAGVDIWHFGDSDPKGFDILRDLRERSGRHINSLHMEFRPLDGHVTPLSIDDLKVIRRLLSSSFLTEAEKASLTAISSAGHKGKFEQESLGRPAGNWPFYH